jgi:hypothetical protein
MKVLIECPVFREYLQKVIPDAFDADGLMDTEHKGVLCREMIDIEGLDVRSLVGIKHFINLSTLDIDNNPNIKHLPRLPNTLEVFYLDHKLKTSVQPVFFYNVWNFVMLDNGRVLWAKYSWDNLVEFKTWVSRREDAGKFAKFISECEAYLAKLNPEQSK